MYKTIDLEDFLIFIWFIALLIINPICYIHQSLKRRKVPSGRKAGYDEDHARVLKLPFGWEKFLIYSKIKFYLLEDGKEDFCEQDVVDILQKDYGLSKRQIKYIRKTGQLTEVFDKLKNLK